MKKEKHFGIRVENSIHAKLCYIAKYDGRSINGQIMYLIKTAIREFEEKHGAIETEENE